MAKAWTVWTLYGESLGGGSSVLVDNALSRNHVCAMCVVVVVVVLSPCVIAGSARLRLSLICFFSPNQVNDSNKGSNGPAGSRFALAWGNIMSGQCQERVSRFVFSVTVCTEYTFTTREGE
jgi:hypothetical protein